VYHTGVALRLALGTPPSLRARTSRAVQAEIAAVATQLFLEKGFDNTTVDEIAAAAGLSRTSFFRYFATKEDVVLGHLEEVGQRALDALVARPDDEHVWTALRHAFASAIHDSAALPEQGLSVVRMLNATTSLKTRQLGKQLGWLDLLVPEAGRRLGGPQTAHDPRPGALVAAALGCFNAAVEQWAAAEGAIELSALLDQAMNFVTIESHSPHRRDRARPAVRKRRKGATK
jgi:AcrR family transcriptional regulator